MSKKGDHQIAGYFDYVVPPLEGFWWQDGARGNIDYSHKDKFNFISLIRLPDFVTKRDFDWAIEEATRKKGQDFSAVEFLNYDEGLVAQSLHLDSYDAEPATVAAMHQYLAEQGCVLDLQNPRYHHEIYLSDPRRCQPAKLKTVLRLPVRRLAA